MRMDMIGDAELHRFTTQAPGIVCTNWNAWTFCPESCNVLVISNLPICGFNSLLRLDVGRREILCNDIVVEDVEKWSEANWSEDI